VSRTALDGSANEIGRRRGRGRADYKYTRAKNKKQKITALVKTAQEHNTYDASTGDCVKIPRPPADQPAPPPLPSRNTAAAATQPPPTTAPGDSGEIH